MGNQTSCPSCDGASCHQCRTKCRICEGPIRDGATCHMCRTKCPICEGPSCDFMTGSAPTCQWAQLCSPVDARVQHEAKMAKLCSPVKARLQHEAEMVKRAAFLERASLCPKCGHGCVAHREGGSCPYDVPSVDPIKAAKAAGEPGPPPSCRPDA